jgi:hypothetical protein
MGDLVRDWTASGVPAVWFYDSNFSLFDIKTLPNAAKYFWLGRSVVSRRKRFGTPMLERGLTWYEYQELYIKKLRTPLTITFAEIATHNHFVLDRGGKVFNRTAPVIKLPADSSEDEHMGLLGLLNSSVACFWLKQVCHNKGEGGGTRVEAGNSALGDEAWKSHFAFNSTKVAEFPLASGKPLDLALNIDRLSREINSIQPAARLARGESLTRASQTAAREHALQLNNHQLKLVGLDCGLKVRIRVA